MNSSSFEGVKPVAAGAHTPLPAGPPSSALVTRTSVSLGTVLMAWLSASQPNMNAMDTFSLWKSVSVWCIGIDQSLVTLCWEPKRRSDW